MALYAIADTHLSISVDKPMDIFGGKWVNYTEKLAKNLEKLNDDDTLVIAGDISWGINLRESLADFKFLENFKGRKIILKGNHDLWWESMRKMKSFLDENDIKSIDFLHNNFFECDNMAICGTRGWTFEENFKDAHNEKIYKRELLRLESSIKQAKDVGFDDIHCFLHYPPVHAKYICAEILDIFEKYDVSNCYYGHLHGGELRNGFEGIKGKTTFKIISGDFLDFEPILIKKD